MSRRKGGLMPTDRATRLIVNAEHLGISKALASRIQRDVQELRVVAPTVVGDDLSAQFSVLIACMAKIQDRLDRANCDTVKAVREGDE